MSSSMPGRLPEGSYHMVEMTGVPSTTKIYKPGRAPHRWAVQYGAAFVVRKEANPRSIAFGFDSLSAALVAAHGLNGIPKPEWRNTTGTSYAFDDRHYFSAPNESLYRCLNAAHNRVWINSAPVEGNNEDTQQFDVANGGGGLDLFGGQRAGPSNPAARFFRGASEAPVRMNAATPSSNHASPPGAGSSRSSSVAAHAQQGGAYIPSPVPSDAYMRDTHDGLAVKGEDADEAFERELLSSPPPPRMQPHYASQSNPLYGGQGNRGGSGSVGIEIAPATSGSLGAGGIGGASGIGGAGGSGGAGTPCGFGVGFGNAAAAAAAGRSGGGSALGGSGGTMHTVPVIRRDEALSMDVNDGRIHMFGVPRGELLVEVHDNDQELVQQLADLLALRLIDIKEVLLHAFYTHWVSVSVELRRTPLTDPMTLRARKLAGIAARDTLFDRAHLERPATQGQPRWGPQARPQANQPAAQHAPPQHPHPHPSPPPPQQQQQ